MAELNYAVFLPLLNAKFKIRFSDSGSGFQRDVHNPEELEATLVEVTERNDARFDRFFLIFETDSDRLLQQNIYTLTHDTLGTHELFLVPVSEKVSGEGEHRRIDGHRYQAVFNLVKQSQ